MRKGKSSAARSSLDSTRTESAYGSFGSVRADSVAYSPEGKSSGLRRPSLMCRSLFFPAVPSPLRHPRYRTMSRTHRPPRSCHEWNAC